MLVLRPSERVFMQAKVSCCLCPPKATGRNYKTICSCLLPVLDLEVCEGGHAATSTRPRAAQPTVQGIARSETICRLPAVLGS